MGKRSRVQHEDSGVEQPQPQTVDDGAWNTPDFRRSVLINLAFVMAPAIVMVALKERTIAAAWFGVGVLVIVLEFKGQIRSLWRSLRSGRRTD
jgi:hypothetical protein